MAEDKIFKLARPVQDISGATVTELTLRHPTAREAFDLGLPFTIGADDSFSFVFPVVRAWLLRLSNGGPQSLKTGPEVIDGLDLSDMMKIATWLAACFDVAGGDLGNSAAQPKP